MKYQSKDKTTSDSSENYLNKQTTSNCDSSSNLNSFRVQSLEDYALLNSSNEENRNIYLVIDSKGKRKLSQELSNSNSSKNLSSIENLAKYEQNSFVKKKISSSINKFVINTSFNRTVDKNETAFSSILQQKPFQQKETTKDKSPKVKKNQTKTEIKEKLNKENYFVNHLLSDPYESKYDFNQKLTKKKIYSTPSLHNMKQMKLKHQRKTILKLLSFFINSFLRIINIDVKNSNETILKLTFIFTFLYVLYFLIIKFISIGSYPIVVFSFY